MSNKKRENWRNPNSKYNLKEYRNLLSIKNTGKIRSEETRTKVKESKIGLKNPMFGKKLTDEHRKKLRIFNIERFKDSEFRKKFGENLQGKKNGFFGKKHSIESRKKIGIKSSLKVYSKEYREKLRIASSGRKQPQEQREKSRQRCLNGLACYMHKFIKNPSKQEVFLRNMIKELHPKCEFQHPVFNYSLDIALVEEKIAIEYDGYYHFDTEEHKKYHKQRQEKIEKEGWNFLRYTMYDKFPNKDQVNEDIKSILERKKEL